MNRLIISTRSLVSRAANITTHHQCRNTSHQSNSSKPGYEFKNDDWWLARNVSNLAQSFFVGSIVVFGTIYAWDYINK